MKNTNRQDVYTRVTNQIVAQLEQGVRPWVKPWSAEHIEGRIVRPLRHNGQPHNGINVLMHWGASVAQGFAAPTWMTFRQAKELGAHVRKGEKGALVVYANSITRTEENDDGEEVERDIPFMKGYTVFNVEQIEGLPEQYHVKPEPRFTDPVERIAHAEAFFAATGANIREAGGRAFYCDALTTSNFRFKGAGEAGQRGAAKVDPLQKSRDFPMRVAGGRLKRSLRPPVRAAGGGLEAGRATTAQRSPGPALRASAPLLALLEPEAVAGRLEDVGVVDQPVDQSAFSAACACAAAVHTGCIDAAVQADRKQQKIESSPEAKRQRREAAEGGVEGMTEPLEGMENAFGAGVAPQPDAQPQPDKPPEETPQGPRSSPRSPS